MKIKICKNCGHDEEQHVFYKYKKGMKCLGFHPKRKYCGCKEFEEKK